MADDGSGGIKQGNAAIALDTPLLEAGVGGEELADLFGMMRDLTVENCFARSTIERRLEVFHETSASPHGTRPKARTVCRQFGNERVLATECGREVFDERVEETLARFRFYASTISRSAASPEEPSVVNPFFPIKENSSLSSRSCLPDRF